jgi:hypothetical protein
MTVDELAARMDQQFAALDQKFEAIDQRFAGVDQRFAGIDRRLDALEKKVDDGFNASKVRDEELLGLMKFGLEARDVLRDEMHRRFDEAARQREDEITSLWDAVRRPGGRT